MCRIAWCSTKPWKSPSGSAPNRATPTSTACWTSWRTPGVPPSPATEAMDAPDRPVVVAAPALRTPRLRLRAHHADDFDTCRAIWSDPEVVRHIGGKPATGEEAWRRLLVYAGLWSLLGYGYWAIEEQASGQYIGDIGFAEFRRDIDPPLRGMLESGWVLARA